MKIFIIIRQFSSHILPEYYLKWWGGLIAFVAHLFVFFYYVCLFIIVEVECLEIFWFFLFLNPVFDILPEHFVDFKVDLFEIGVLGEMKDAGEGRASLDVVVVEF